MVPTLFEERVLAPKAGVWLVLCTASFSAQSLAIAPVFGQRTASQAHSGINFAEMNLTEWPVMADQLKVRF